MSTMMIVIIGIVCAVFGTIAVAPLLIGETEQQQDPDRAESARSKGRRRN